MAREHGTRPCYIFGPDPGSDRTRGCRCQPCCEANRAYSRMQDKRLRRIRNGKTDPVLVDARPARDHLRWLAARGVGLRAVAARTNLGRTALSDIKAGRTARVRPATLEQILEVFPSDARPGAYVPAAATWKLIDDLLAHGWTRTAIARALGSTAKNPALQIGRDRCSAANAAKIRELHQRALVRVLVDRENATEARRAFRAQARERVA